MIKVEGASSSQSGQVQKSSVGEQTDSVSMELQEQIANAQQELQNLASNETMSSEQKMKKRQDLQKKISDLNNQLRQHQIDVRKDKQQEKEAKSTDNTNSQPKEQGTYLSISKAGMQAMLSADSAMKQAQVHGTTSTKLQGRAGVVEAEIKQDAGQGRSVEAKQEELADIQKKESKAQAAQIHMLGDAAKKMRENAESERKKAAETGRADNQKMDTKDTKKSQKDQDDNKLQQSNTDQDRVKNDQKDHSKAEQKEDGNADDKDVDTVIKKSMAKRDRLIKSGDVQKSE